MKKIYLVKVALEKTIVVKAENFEELANGVKHHTDGLRVLDISDPQDQKYDDGFKATADIWHAKEVG